MAVAGCMGTGEKHFDSHLNATTGSVLHHLKINFPSKELQERRKRCFIASSYCKFESDTNETTGPIDPTKTKCVRIEMTKRDEIKFFQSLWDSLPLNGTESHIKPTSRTQSDIEIVDSENGTVPTDDTDEERDESEKQPSLSEKSVGLIFNGSDDTSSESMSSSHVSIAGPNSITHNGTREQVPFYTIRNSTRVQKRRTTRKNRVRFEPDYGHTESSQSGGELTQKREIQNEVPHSYLRRTCVQGDEMRMYTQNRERSENNWKQLHQIFDCDRPHSTSNKVTLATSPSANCDNHDRGKTNHSYAINERSLGDYSDGDDDDADDVNDDGYYKLENDKINSSHQNFPERFEEKSQSFEQSDLVSDKEHSLNKTSDDKKRYLQKESSLSDSDNHGCQKDNIKSYDEPTLERQKLIRKIFNDFNVPSTHPTIHSNEELDFSEQNDSLIDSKEDSQVSSLNNRLTEHDEEFTDPVIETNENSLPQRNYSYGSEDGVSNRSQADEEHLNVFPTESYSHSSRNEFVPTKNQLPDNRFRLISRDVCHSMKCNNTRLEFEPIKDDTHESNIVKQNIADKTSIRLSKHTKNHSEISQQKSVANTVSPEGLKRTCSTMREEFSCLKIGGDKSATTTISQGKSNALQKKAVDKAGPNKQFTIGHDRNFDCHTNEAHSKIDSDSSNDFHPKNSKIHDKIIELRSQNNSGNEKNISTGQYIPVSTLVSTNDKDLMVTSWIQSQQVIPPYKSFIEPASSSNSRTYCSDPHICRSNDIPSEIQYLDKLGNKKVLPESSLKSWPKYSKGNAIDRPNLQRCCSISPGSIRSLTNLNTIHDYEHKSSERSSPPIVCAGRAIITRPRNPELVSDDNILSCHESNNTADSDRANGLLICRLCNVVANSPLQMKQHTSGTRHIMATIRSQSSL